MENSIRAEFYSSVGTLGRNERAGLQLEPRERTVEKQGKCHVVTRFVLSRKATASSLLHHGTGETSEDRTDRNDVSRKVCCYVFRSPLGLTLLGLILLKRHI